MIRDIEILVSVRHYGKGNLNVLGHYDRDIEILVSVRHYGKGDLYVRGSI